MKPGIHPEYVECTVLCACGNTFVTRSTKPSIKLEICSNCHPFFTGRQKFVDTAGRVERFQKRFAKTGGETVKAKKAAPAMAKGQKSTILKKKIKILSSTPIKAKPGGASAPKGAPKPSAAKSH
jgi:large subunit ribosomal protein L31